MKPETLVSQSIDVMAGLFQMSLFEGNYFSLKYQYNVFFSVSCDFDLILA
jgi:hypothetical protein